MIEQWAVEEALQMVLVNADPETPWGQFVFPNIDPGEMSFPRFVMQDVPTGVVDPTLQGGAAQGTGYFMITVITEEDTSARPGAILGARVASLYPYTMTLLTATGDRVKITKPAEVLQGFPQNSTWRTPVRVDYQVS